MSIYQDIKTLGETGSWPDGIEPDWALEIAEKLRCPSTNVVVQEHGLLRVIEDLQNALSTIRDECFRRDYDVKPCFGSTYRTYLMAADALRTLEGEQP